MRRRAESARIAPISHRLVPALGVEPHGSYEAQQEDHREANHIVPPSGDQVRVRPEGHEVDDDAPFASDPRIRSHGYAR